MFQSPDGDFVYSDVLDWAPSECASISFNPLTGISSILTKFEQRPSNLDKCVSIP